MDSTKGTVRTTQILMDREQKLIAELLIRFKGIIDLIPNREGSEESPDERLSAASQSYQIEVKTAELIKSAEDLLTLTRQLKEMWAFGKLRERGEGDEDSKLEENATQVGTMIEKIMDRYHQSLHDEPEDQDEPPEQNEPQEQDESQVERQ